MFSVTVPSSRSCSETLMFPVPFHGKLCNIGAWTVMASAATRMGILEIAAHQLILSLWLVIAYVQGKQGSGLDAFPFFMKTRAYKRFMASKPLDKLLLFSPLRLPGFSGGVLRRFAASAVMLGEGRKKIS